jgi:hypothetical protein
VGGALGWAPGGTAAGLVGVFATPTFGWKALYWVGSMSFLLLPFLHAQLPESPKFLVLKDRSEAIRTLLSRLRPERASFYASADISVARRHELDNPVAVLLTQKYRRMTLSIWLSAFLSLFCVFGLSGWIPTIMMQRGETFSASFGFGAVMQFMSFLGALVLGHLIDGLGRSWGLLAVWWATGGLAVLALVAFNAHLVNVTAVAVAGFCIIGAAIRPEQFYRCILRDRGSRHRRRHGTGDRPRRRHPWAPGRRHASADLPKPGADVRLDRPFRHRGRRDHPARRAAVGRAGECSGRNRRATRGGASGSVTLTRRCGR